MQKNYKKIIKFIVLTFIFINFIGIFNTKALTFDEINNNKCKGGYLCVF